MPKKNQIKWRIFQKVVRKQLKVKFAKYEITEKKGSGIRYEAFSSVAAKKPSEMWVVHRDEFVHKGDLKKTCDHLGITTDEFLDLI